MHRRSRRGGGVLAAFVAVCLSAAGLSQTSPATYSAQAPGGTQVSFDVNVLDKLGEPVPSLESSDLVVLDNERVVTGVTLSPAGSQPESVCIVVDDSGSTYETAGLVQAELRRLLAALPAEDDVCLVVFAAKAVALGGPGVPRSKLVSALSRLPKPYGPSATVDALLLATKRLAVGAGAGGRAIILIGDGGESHSESSESELTAALRAVGAPVVYVISNRETDKDKEGTQRLMRLTEQTGGTAYFVKKESQVSAATGTLVRVLKGRYRLTFDSAATADSTHRLSLGLSNRMKQKVTMKAVREYDVVSQ